MNDTIQPVKLSARKVPVSVKPRPKQELDRLQDLGIIVRVTEPTDWVSTFVITMKPSGAVRLCTDPKPLKKAPRQSHYPVPKVDDTLPDLSEAKVF